jgi:hypothetical protein
VDSNRELPGLSVPPWTLVSSHGLVLFYVATNPGTTIKNMAAGLGISERRVSDVLRDLEDAGLLHVEKHGRQNRYVLDHQASFRHPVLKGVPFQAFVELWRKDSDAGLGARRIRRSGRSPSPRESP